MRWPIMVVSLLGLRITDQATTRVKLIDRLAGVSLRRRWLAALHSRCQPQHQRTQANQAGLQALAEDRPAGYSANCETAAVLSRPFLHALFLACLQGWLAVCSVTHGSRMY